MDKLFEYQEELLQQVDDRFFRSMYYQIDWDERFFGVTGLRGTGKTTMLLQHLKYSGLNRDQTLYVSADHTWFYDNTLTELARQFVKYDGKRLYIDEIHRYPGWSRELKNIYDGLPNIQIIFTASSVLDILKGEGDLSRRAITHELPGLSFREYLVFQHNQSFEPLLLDQLLADSKSVASTILKKTKPLPAFKAYLQRGYFPFSAESQPDSFLQKLNQVINTIMEVDLQVAEDYSAANTIKMKKLLGVIAESAPFEPNISKIAERLGMGRDTIKMYLNNLDQARLLNLLMRSTKGVASLQKPDKIYLENTNFSHALKAAPEVGTIRETFFINQLRNAGHRVELAKHGDFLVDGHFVFEVGGPSKDSSQLKKEKKAWLALDELEHPHLNRIPLWLFGFLY